MASFFELVETLQEQIDFINQLLSGDEATTVIINGIEKSSVQKSINDNFAALRVLVQGRIAFATKAEMDVFGQPANGELAEVWNDPVFENNGLYGWESGAWARAELDSMVTAALVATFGKSKSIKTESSLAAATLANYGGNIDVYPVVTDNDGKILIGVSKQGELIADLGEGANLAVLEAMAKQDQAQTTEDSFIRPLVTDLSGKVLLGFDTQTGAIIGDLSKAISQSLNTIFVSSDEVSDVQPIVVDNGGQVLLGVNKKDGELVARLPQSAPFKQKELEPIIGIYQVPESDWNHFIFYGQSLSVGIQSKPAITLTAKYNTLTFGAGPKSTMEGSVGYNPGMDSYKLLTEDNLWGDLPPNGLNHGETPCSGFSDSYIQLSAKDNGINWNTNSKQLFVNTAGRGSSSITSLLPGGSTSDGEWWLNFKNSVEQAQVLAQAEGKTYSLNGVGWIQGEGNAVSSDYDTYKQNLGVLFDAIQQVSKDVTGLEHKVPFLSYQTFARSGQADQIPQAQLDFCNDQDGAYLATPIYHLPLAHDGHFNNLGSYLVGRYFGRAYKHIAIDKVTPPWINPISATCSEQKIIVSYEVPKPPLVIDYQNLAVTTNAGFCVVDANGEVEIAEIKIGVTGTQVEIDLSRGLVGQAQLRYAFDHLGEGLINYAISASGNLRDSEPETTIVLGKEYKLFNVAPHHKLEIIKL